MVQAMVMDIRVRRVDRKRLARLKKNLPLRADRLADAYAKDVVDGAKRRVHVITGHLRNSIHRQRLGYARHRVIVGAHYGIYEEYGTRYRPPHPFFRPAVVAAHANFRRNARNLFK